MTKTNPRDGTGWWRTLVFTSLAAALTVAAGFVMFSAFMFYDDEGYVLISLRNFAEYGELYRRVYSQYGPFPFVFYHALHLLGWPLTHTAGRLLTVAMWAGTAVFSAVLVGHATRNFALKLAVLAAVFDYLWIMASEPSHPGGLIAFSTAALATMGYVWLATERTPAWALATGAITMMLVLTKINVGGLVALSALAWLLLHHRDPRIRRHAPALLILAGVALPLFLMRPLLDAEWVRTFALNFATSAVAIAATVSLGAAPRAGWATLRSGAIAAAVVGIIVLGVVFARGTTPADLVQGILLGPLRQPVNFSLNYRWPAGAREIALGSIVLCAVAWLLRRRDVTLVNPIMAALRIAVAIGLAAGIAQFPQLSPDRPIFALTAASIWIFLWPLPDETPATVAARNWVGLLLLGQYLHPFPVAGSQIAWGTYLVLPLGALSAGQAASWLVQRFNRPGAGGWRREARVLQVAISAFALLTGWRLVQVGLRYRGGSDLGLPGAEAIRLPTEATALFRTLTLNAAAHGDMLLGEPGMFSLNLWSGVPTPTLANVTHWFSLLDGPRQQAIIDALEKHPQACVVVQREHVKFLATRGLAPTGPLHDYVANRFAPAFTLGDFEFCVRRGRRIEPLMLGDILTRRSPSKEAADTEDTQLKLVALLPENRLVEQIEIASPGSGRAGFALSAANARVEVTPANLRGEPIGPAGTRAWPFAVKGPAILAVYFHHDAAKPLRGDVIIFRGPAGVELALARLRP